MPGVNPGMEGTADLGALTWKYDLEVRCSFQILAVSTRGEADRATEPRKHFIVPSVNAGQSHEEIEGPEQHSRTICSVFSVVHSVILPFIFSFFLRHFILSFLF